MLPVIDLGAFSGRGDDFLLSLQIIDLQPIVIDPGAPNGVDK
jgi:hypothetical protein